MNDLVISLGAVLALFLIELALGLRWSRWYCNTGLPIFWRRIERASGLADLDLDALQKSCATAAGAPIVFRRIGPELIAFREKPFGGSMHYPSREGDLVPGAGIRDVRVGEPRRPLADGVLSGIDRRMNRD